MLWSLICTAYPGGEGIDWMANWVVPVINRINESSIPRIHDVYLLTQLLKIGQNLLRVVLWYVVGADHQGNHLQISVYSLILDVIVYSLFILHDLCSCGCMYCDMGTCNIYNISCDATILVHLLVFANYQIYHMTVFSYPYRTI